MNHAKTLDRLADGRLRFNAGRYFEAHEVWEEAWLVEEGAWRTLLQGLIQIAAGCHKASEGNAIGCARSVGAGVEKLRRVSAFAPWTAEFASAIALMHVRALQWERGQAVDAGPIPQLPRPPRREPAR